MRVPTGPPATVPSPSRHRGGKLAAPWGREARPGASWFVSAGVWQLPASSPSPCLSFPRLGSRCRGETTPSCWEGSGAAPKIAPGVRTQPTPSCPAHPGEPRHSGAPPRLALCWPWRGRGGGSTSPPPCTQGGSGPSCPIWGVSTPNGASCCAGWCSRQWRCPPGGGVCVGGVSGCPHHGVLGWVLGTEGGPLPGREEPRLRRALPQHEARADLHQGAG